MRKFLSSIIVFLFLVSSMNSTIFAATWEMCEGDLQVTINNQASQSISFDIKSSGITAYSPFRSGDIGSGMEDLVTITSQFNQPRYEDSIERSHKGVDMRSVSGSVARPVFLAYDNAKIMTAQSRNGYGNTVVAQHRYVDSTGKEYYFQTLYAHLANYNVSTNNTYTNSYTTKVGTSGNSGLNGGAVHLHLEFRTPQNATGSSLGLYTYAPSVFYWRKGEWGNSTSFINAVGHYGNTVEFNIVSHDSGAYSVAAENVKIYHKKSTETSFRSSSMTKTGNVFSYTFSTSTYPVGTIVQYYIEAKESRWNGKLYAAYRPYHYRESTPPPSNQCFTHTMVSNSSRSNINSYSKEILSSMSVEDVAEVVKNSPYPLEPMVGNDYAIESTNRKISNQTEIGANIVAIDDSGIVVRDINNSKEYIVEILFELDHTPEIGAFYWVNGVYDGSNNSISVSNPEDFRSPQRYAHTD